MSQSLFSEQWYRVAELHPRLRAQVRVQRQVWRDQRWYLLSDDATGRQHRINESAYQLVGRCDGRRSVQQVWDAALDALGDAAPTQDEAVELFIRLHESELMKSERPPDAQGLAGRRRERVSQRRRAMLNPFAFRLPLGDPSPWLAPLDPLGRLLFRPLVLWIWLIGVAVAALAAGSEWQGLRAYAQLHLLTPRFAAIAWICYPLLKLLHELAHALAVRRWGGEVHEVGIALLVAVPVPYVDASAASGFLSRWRRALVAGVGIMVELGAAAIALAVWLSAQPGLAKDVAFVVLFIGAASTVVFNANPLLRFDGYYVLCDLLDLPNLAARSNALWGYLLRRHLLRTSAERPQLATGELKWLLGYAPLSLIYRLFVAVAILLWLGSKWFLLGLAAAAYLAISMLIWPLARGVRRLLASAAPGRELSRVRLGLVLLAAVPGLVLFVLPLPWSTVAPAVVWLPEKAQVRPEVEGFVTELPVTDGAKVNAGDLLVVLENPDLAAARDQVASRLEGLSAERYRLMLRDPVGAQNQAEEIDRLEAELARAEERIGQLQVRAQVPGRLVMPRQPDRLGSFAARGTVLGYVFQNDEALVRAAVPPQDAYLVRDRTRSVEVRLADEPQRVIPAATRLEVPAATHTLPSPALGDRGGGAYPTDPLDEEGTQALEPVFLVDLRLPHRMLERVGGRAWVRFAHGYEPLGVQLLRRAAQLFLTRFDPGE